MPAAPEISPSHQHHQPRRQRRRGCDGGAGSYSATKYGAVSRPQRVAFRNPRSAIFRSPLRDFVSNPALGRTPWGSGLAERSLEPRFSSEPLLAPGGSRRSGPPGSRAISLSFQAPAVCPWDVGWRHPRPVAANDAKSVAAPQTGGISANPWAVGDLPAGLMPRQCGRRIANAADGVRPCGSDPMARHVSSPFQSALSADILSAALVAMRGSYAETTSPCRDPHARTMKAHGNT